ncbi:polycystic kidney disease protein 1-like 2 [Branchiostoma floridae]|uniref:Polycystic kidney disease protein 1-like 2 n=1 Tax=Branchiostoma floridae TaxID=7739 RepID=A0A9J7HIK9_BRAFL|nr:polycystic kidney disease protein 1-like 2 [Branchiostoma floridae]
MLTNITFFGRGDDFDPPEPLVFGGTEINIPVSLPQIMIGIQSAAIILPVNILIVFLFRNTGPQVTNKSKAEDQGKTKSSLPWWAVYIGWLLVWSASFVAAFFTVLYTLSFGRAKAEAWLVTFLTSFVTDLFLMQPFKLLIVAVIFAMVSKTPVEDDDPPSEPLQPGEEYLQPANQENDSRHMSSETGSPDSPPDESTLAEQRQKSAEKRKRRAAVLEVLVFGLFISVIMAASYGERSPMAFYMTQNVERQILDGGDVAFSEISDIPTCWTWITTGLMPALHVGTWYNGRAIAGSAAMLLEDMVSYPLGHVQLRQMRLKPGKHCEPPKQMLNVTSRCIVEYSNGMADNENYILQWAPQPNTTVNATDGSICDHINAQIPPGLYDCVGNPWMHTSVSLTDDMPYFGKHGSYIGGGYITSLRTTNDTNFLQQNGWLDENTRALFIELILYNPHVNLFSVVSLAAEFTNLGAVYKSSEIVTVRLIQHDVILLLALRGVLALFLLYFTLREGKSLLSRPLEYLMEFWSWIELLVITIGFSTIVIYFYTQNIIDQVAEQRQNGNSAFHLYKSAVSWFQLSTYFRRLYLLRNLKHFNVSIGDLVTVYVTYIRPVLEYCAPVWHSGLTTALSDRIEKVQRRAVRIILGQSYTSYTDACSDLGLPSLQARRLELITHFAN